MNDNINEKCVLNINTKRKEGSDIDYEVFKLYKKVFIRDYNDDHIAAFKQSGCIKINKGNNNEMNNCINELYVNGINIDFGNIMFNKLKKLTMKKSLCYVNTNELDIIIEHDYNSIVSFMQYYITNKISINNIVLLITNDNSISIDLSHLLSIINKIHCKQISITIKNSVIKLTTPLNKNDTFPNIISFSLFPINTLHQNIFSTLISLMPNLSKVEFNFNKINKDDYNTISLCSNIKYIKCISDNECLIDDINLSKKCINLTNYDNPMFNFNLYSIELLESISLPLFDFSKHDKIIVLYGEANLDFYNDNNCNFIINVINNFSNEKLNELTLCNFDIENIDYLSQLLSKIKITSNKLTISNLNLSNNFINVINNTSFFNAYYIHINNLLFLSIDIENCFYKTIHSYAHMITKIHLQNLDNLNGYENMLLSLNNLNSLELTDIYEMDFNMLYTIILNNKNISQLKLVNIELNPNDDDNDKKENMKKILNAIDVISKNVKSITLQGNEDYKFILDNIHIFSFEMLSKLGIIIENVNQNDLIEIILSKLKAPKLNVLKCKMFSVSNVCLQKLFKMFPLLYKIK